MTNEILTAIDAVLALIALGKYSPLHETVKAAAALLPQVLVRIRELNELATAEETGVKQVPILLREAADLTALRAQLYAVVNNDQNSRAFRIALREADERARRAQYVPGYDPVADYQHTPQCTLRYMALKTLCAFKARYAQFAGTTPAETKIAAQIEAALDGFDIWAANRAVYNNVGEMRGSLHMRVALMVAHVAAMNGGTPEALNSAARAALGKDIVEGIVFTHAMRKGTDEQSVSVYEFLSAFMRAYVNSDGELVPSFRTGTKDNPVRMAAGTIRAVQAAAQRMPIDEIVSALTRNILRFTLALATNAKGKEAQHKCGAGCNHDPKVHYYAGDVNPWNVVVEGAEETPALEIEVY